MTCPARLVRIRDNVSHVYVGGTLVDLSVMTGGRATLRDVRYGPFVVPPNRSGVKVADHQCRVRGENAESCYALNAAWNRRY